MLFSDLSYTRHTTHSSRLATDKFEYMQKKLNITDPIDRRKLYVKASDLVLFGPPAGK